MLFCDLSDSTRIAASTEAEEFQELLAALREIFTTHIERHGGTIAQVMGDGVLAIFGYPEATESDARRALLAALDMHRAVRELRLDIPMNGRKHFTLHSGVHSGLVLLGEGDSVRGRFELLGTAINIAARLSDLADADELLISAETLGPESERFELAPARMEVLQGQDVPTRIYPVLGLLPEAVRMSRESVRRRAPFVGRDPQMARLHSHLGSVASGESVHLAIVAPPGFGKTRLIREFLGQVGSSCDIAQAECEGRFSSEPLHPFLDILRSRMQIQPETQPHEVEHAIDAHLSVLRRDLRPFREDLQRALAPGRSGASVSSETGGRLVEAISNYLSACTVDRPMVLFVDDAQWADDLTRQVLQSIRGLRDSRVLALSAMRVLSAADTHFSDVLALDLPPLADDEARQMVTQLVPRASPFDVEEIVRYAGGNSLFIEELCHSLDGGAQSAPLRPNNAGVAWLNVLIESRFSRLSPDQAALAQSAAVIGLEVPVWLLRSLTQVGPGDPLLQALMEQDFIVDSGRSGVLRFKHGIVRDVIYDSVGLRERRQLHRRIAQMYLDHTPDAKLSEVAEALAFHYEAAGDADRWAEFAELAGDKARGATALDRAISQYGSALRALERLEPLDSTYQRWSRISANLGFTAIYDPGRSQLAAMRRAAEWAAERHDARALADAQFWVGYIQYALGDGRQSLESLQLAVKAAEGVGERGLVARARGALGQALVVAARYAEADALLAPMAPKPGQAPSGVEGRAYSVANWATMRADKCEFGSALEAIEWIVRGLEGASHAVKGSVLDLYALILIWQGRWQDAEEAARAAVEVAQRVKSLYLLSTSVGLRAYAQWRMDPSAAVAQAIDESTQWLESRERGLFISLNYGWQAELAEARDDSSALRRALAKAMARARQFDYLGLPMACRAMALYLARSADPRRARRFLRRADWAADKRASPHERILNAIARARVEQALGAKDAAFAALEGVPEHAASLGLDWHAAQATHWQLRLHEDTRHRA